MRKCKFVKREYEYTSTHNRELVTKEYYGTFIKWGTDFIEYDNGYASYTAGVIELDCGRVKLIKANDITFTDKKVHEECDQHQSYVAVRLYQT